MDCHVTSFIKFLHLPPPNLSSNLFHACRDSNPNNPLPIPQSSSQRLFWGGKQSSLLLVKLFHVAQENLTFGPEEENIKSSLTVQSFTRNHTWDRVNTWGIYKHAFLSRNALEINRVCSAHKMTCTGLHHMQLYKQGIFVQKHTTAIFFTAIFFMLMHISLLI